MDSNLTYSSSCQIIDPATLFTDGYELTNQTIIESQEYLGSFTPNENRVEFYIYDANKAIIQSNYDFQGWRIEENPNPSSSFNAQSATTTVQSSELILDPEYDIAMEGFTNGDMYAVYNFINLELASSPTVPYYLAEISSNRTEIRLKSNFITTREMRNTLVDLRKKLANPEYFDELYISFGNNEYHIGINVKYDDSVASDDFRNSDVIRKNNAVGEASILIKLFDPLPLKYDITDTLYVATKTAESQAYLVNYLNDFTNDYDQIISIKGPNSNLKIQDFVNNSSEPRNKNKLLGTKSTGSKDQLLNRLSQTGVQLTPNYSTASFSEFINFASAKSQVSNFVEKVSRIQSYEADLNVLTSTTASNPGSIPISESIASLYTKIEDEITAFSGFDYYQYYATSSDAYPKSGTAFPLNLEATQSALAQNWINASEASASRYDEDNQNWLYYTVPDFIKENSSNNNYLEFVNMVGQSFDEVWLYTKAITERLNTTNDLDKGVPLQLADDVITSLGYTGFGNNYNNQDNFIGLIGSDNGIFLPPTGSELINHYIAVNGPGGVINYWDDGYSWEDYVQSIQDLGYPYPIDKVSKEIFKRLYHNMAYLVKKKGTISGLRQLINIWGIPNTILRINEFGGKNKDEVDDYDLWYQRYSYAYTPVPAGTNYASSSIRVPWQPLYRNYNYASNQLLSTSEIAAVGGPITGGSNGVSNSYGIDTQFTVTGGGSGGTLTITASGGNVTKVILTQGNSSGYSANSVITITGAQINNLNDPQLGAGWSGTSTFSVAAGNLNTAQGDIVPDGIGFRFKTTGYPSSSYAGLFNTQSLFVKKSITADTDVADLGIVLYYTGSMSGSGAGNTGATYDGGSSSKYKDYGEMRFLISGSAAGGGTAISEPIYLPFFDKGWWSIVLQRDQHPSASQNDLDTTYTLYAKNKIYDGADGNQIGFQGSASLTIDASSGGSSSLNYAWNRYVATNNVAGGYLGGWGSTLGNGESGSIGVGPKSAADSNIAIGLQGKNFSGSFQEFRYYSHDISESVFNDFVMNPESIEGNKITGSESSFDIVNFRAPLGNELEYRFTSSEYLTAYTEQRTSVHPAITGSSPLFITASFVNPANGTLTSSYDINYNVNSSTRTYSNTNVETYFLDQPSIGIRNRVSNKIKYSTNLNFGNTLSNKVSIQQDPPMSQSYTDNINSLEVAFSPTDEVNDDIIQALGYGSIQEVIADPRFRSSSDYSYPGLDAIAKDYFKKYTNRSQIDYLRLIKYFDDSLFKAIKNYVPARTSVSTGIVVKQNMLERSRYREPQMDIVTTQSYAPFNQPLTAKNLEITGNIETNQLWNPLTQTTYYSSSDVYNFEGGPGGSVNQYNVLREGGSLFILENDDVIASAASRSLIEAIPLEEVSKDIVIVDAGPQQTQASATIEFGANTSQTTSPGDGDTDLQNHSITIISINPGDVGTVITKNYCTSDTADTGDLDGTSDQFVRFRATGTAAAKAQQFADAVNSVNGQGSSAATPTLTAVVQNTDEVLLTQLYGGTDANTSITYGNKIDTTIGAATFTSVVTAGANYTAGQTQNNSPTTNAGSQIGIGTGLTVTAATTNTGVSDGMSSCVLGNSGGRDYKVNDTFSVNNLTIVALTTTAIGKVNAINTIVDTAPAAFTGGTSRFSNIFLNVDKSLRTPIYIDYDFETATSDTDIRIEASSSKRGTVYSNTTNYTSQNPAGSILLNTSGEKQYLDIHPGEDMYLFLSSPIVATTNTSNTGTIPFGNFFSISGTTGTPAVGMIITSTTDGVSIPDGTTVNFAGATSMRLSSAITLASPGPSVLNFDNGIEIDDYQLIIGENVIITSTLAAETTSASTTLLVDNLNPADKEPSVGATVTGPNIKAGVVTVLGAVTNGGTGYDPSVTQVLATSGAGGGNLTLTVTTNASGVVTTAAISGAANPGTNYTTGDIVTIVGGDNNAKVAITTASPKTCTVTAFDPTNNKVTFNQNQSVTDNSKVTFTVPNVIPNADTEPVSQQGYFEYNVTPLGVDTVWDSTQEQFYDGEYSGSELKVETREQYNPYRKVKGNSLPIAETNITVNTANAVASSGFGLTGNTGNAFSFATSALNGGVSGKRETLLGITALELIPYQTYEVTYTATVSSGGGFGVGWFPENYGYNNTEYGFYPLIVSGLNLGSGGTGYSPNGGIATTPPGARIPTIATGGTGYPISSTFIIGTEPKDGAGQTLEVTTNGSGVITAVTLVEPGSGYLVDGSGNPTVLTISGGFLDPNDVNNVAATINAGAGGVVVKIIDGGVDAAGTITAGNKIEIQDGGNGLYQRDDVITLTGGDGNATIVALQPTATFLNGVSSGGSDNFIRPGSATLTDYKFRFKFLPPLSGDTSEKGRYSLGWYCTTGGSQSQVGTVSNIVVTGIGGIYEKVEAPIFLTQQDEGYDNQRDYQNMSNEDALGNTISPINLIFNTESIVYNNSEYNPLSNNINTNRSSSTQRYVLSYGATQSVPNNIDLVITASYFPTSPSGTFPELADVPDSNYTMPSSVNARYAGTKLKSLTYNFFTPSGSIGPPTRLLSATGVSPNVATEFIDGSLTSSFQQTPAGAGSGSWAGDSNQYEGLSTIDKHPIYMARFENSYEQLNLYDSYQFNIDQLIEVPFEPIAGEPLTPNAITIDGSNRNKKVVSSVFEPKRKAQISYLNPKTQTIDYTTMQVGNFDILSGATEFLTLNSNAKSRVSGSIFYNYTKGGQLVTSSLTQDQGVVQMVTSSLTIGDPQFAGRLDTTTTLAFTGATVGGAAASLPISTAINDGGSSTLVQAYNITSVGGPGTGGAVNVIFNTGGDIIANSGANNIGDVAVQGTGYISGETVKVTIDTRAAGASGQIILFFQVSSTNLLSNPSSKSYSGFLLSGSLTTGDFPPIRNSSIVPGTILGFIGAGNGAGNPGVQNKGTVVVPTTNYYLGTNPASADYNKRIPIAEGSGATVAITSDGTNATTLVIVDGGSGYRPGDQLGVFADIITDVNYQGNSTPIFSGDTSGILTLSIEDIMLEGQSSPFLLNFNPTAVSSSLVTGSLGAGTTSTIEQQLLVGGPQLAVFHMFNTTVSSSFFDVNPSPTDINVGPTSLLWTTSGSNPSSPENYYNWSPEFSDCGSYTNTNTPFLLERGDIIRVEGTLNTITAANVSQSTNTIQDFTVEELLPVTYTSSFSNANLFSQLLSTTLTTSSGKITVDTVSGTLANNTYTLRNVFSTTGTGTGAVFTVLVAGGTITEMTATSPGVGYKDGDKITFATGDLYAASPQIIMILNASAFEDAGGINTLQFTGTYNGAFANTNTKGTVTPSALLDGVTRTFSYEIGTAQGSQLLVFLSNTTGSTQDVNGTVSANIKCTIANSIEEWTFTGGSNIPEGTRFEVSNTTVQDANDGWGNSGGTIQFEMINGCITHQPSSNNFSFGVDVGGTAESGSVTGFHNYKKGEIGFTAPTFVRVTPDPTQTLVGLPGGEVLKMTMRRQIEADDKVMLKNIFPPSGSLGVETPSGQGFLIPNDFSPIQKENALNIINQLKGLNAFDKPVEPGITRTDNIIIRGDDQNNSGGTGSGNGGGPGMNQ